MKRIIALILLIAMCLSLAACAESSGGGKSKKPKDTTPSEGVLADGTPIIENGEKVTGDTCEFSIEYITITDDVIPPQAAAGYLHYPAEDGKTYVDLCVAYKNTADESVCAEDIITGQLIYKDKYKYDGFAIAEQNNRSKFVSANIADIAPLSTEYVHYLFEVPEEVKEATDEVVLKMTIGGEECAVVIPDEDGQGSVAVKPEWESALADFSSTPVTITFYHNMGMSLQSTLDSYIAKFNEIYPNITIEHMQCGSYDDIRDQIKTEITVGAQPNITLCYPDHVALYNKAKAVATLDEFIASTATVTRADGTKEIIGLTVEQQADFIEGFYNEGKVFGDDKMYSLPLSKSTEVLYYNKTFFEQNNLKVPTTWDEMEEVCKKIKEIDPYSIPLGYDSESNWFITMCEQYGSPYTSATGENYLFDNDTNKQFAKRFREWYQKGYVTTQELFGTYTSDLFVGTYGTMGYMCIASSAGARYQRPAANEYGQYAFEVGIAMIPQVDKNNPKVISQGPNLCILNDENPNEVIASWLFMKYLTTNADFQMEYSLTNGYMPVLKSVVNHPEYQYYLQLADGGNNIQWLAIKTALNQMDAYYVSPAFVGSAVAREEVGYLLVRAMYESYSGSLDAFIDSIFANAVEECKYRAS